MSDQDHCPQHPTQPVTAVCSRFNRRFCELCFGPEGDGVKCLSAGMHCKERSHCLVWARIREQKRKRKASRAEGLAGKESIAPPSSHDSPSKRETSPEASSPSGRSASRRSS